MLTFENLYFQQTESKIRMTNLKSTWKKRLLFVGGTISLLLGIVGIFIPLLPTTPFLLLTAYWYSKSSEKYYNWLINNKIFGKYIKAYREGKGITLATKISSLFFLWLTIGATSFYFLESLFVKIILIVIAIGVTIHLLRIKTFYKKNITRK